MSFKQPNNLAELIPILSARPAMYVGQYDYFMATAFVEGFVFARNTLNDGEEHRLLDEFGLWLSQKFDRPKNWRWSGVIKDCFVEDEQALANLPRLFEEFNMSKPRR